MGLTDEQYRKVMRKGWNLTPTIYEQLWTPVLGRHSAACVERLGLNRTDRVLDVATGPGTAAILAADLVPDGSVHGVDISDRYVEVATAAAAGRKNVRFSRHAMETLDLPDASYEAGMCVLGLMYAAPVSSALAEVARVLVPGGRFSACVWGRRDRCAFREVFSILGRRLQMDICPLFFALGAPSAFASALDQAGFVNAHEERVNVTLVWRNREEACAAIFDGGPGAFPYSMFSDDVRREVCDEYIASLEPYRSGEGFEAPAEFVYATARRPSPG
jgi:ubiquinone/menaquinone biosynthesis C-methylase UbiE